MFDLRKSKLCAVVKKYRVNDEGSDVALLFRPYTLCLIVTWNPGPVGWRTARVRLFKRHRAQKPQCLGDEMGFRCIGKDVDL